MRRNGVKVMQDQDKGENMKRLPYNNIPGPGMWYTCSADALHEWKEFFIQEIAHYKTLEPDKAYMYQGYLERVEKCIKLRGV